MTVSGCIIGRLIIYAARSCRQHAISADLCAQVMYDPKQTDYKALLKVFLEQHDPTSLNKQGGDAGTQYRSGLYFHSPEQKQIAEELISEAASSYEVRRQNCSSELCQMCPVGI